MSLLPSSNLNSRGYRRHIPDYELIDDDVQEENGDDDDQHVGDHSVRTAPVFTEDTFDVLGSANFPQKAVYGRLLSQRLGTSAEASNAINPCVYVNTNAPFSAVVCGVQGSGKSHSTSVLLESCLITDPRLGTLPEPLSGILFHFDSAAGSASAQPCEAAYLSSLHASRGGSAKAPEVTVLVLPSSLRSMTRVYQDLPHVKVRPLHFAAEDISGERLLAMMKVDDGTQMPLYMETIMAILRSMDSEDTFDYDDFRSKLSEQKFNPSQKAMLNIRLALLDSCLAGGNLQNRISNYFEKGHLTIIDLSSPYMDSTSACGFFDIILGLFIETNTGTSGKIVVLDEAHKYLSEGGGGSRLTESLLSVIRQQRHLGTRVVISTQEPTVVPAKFLELCSFVIAHRFSSPKWLQHLAKHMSAADSSMDELLSKIISLRTGQAILFSPSALCARIPDPSAAAAVYHGPSRSISKPDILPLGQGYLIVHSRQRITRDGGQSILAVQNLEEVASLVATTNSRHSEKLSHASRPSSSSSPYLSWGSDINQTPAIRSSRTERNAGKSSSEALESRVSNHSLTVPTPALPCHTIPFMRYIAQRAAQGEKGATHKEIRQHFAMRGLVFDESLLTEIVLDAESCGFDISMQMLDGKGYVAYTPKESTPCNILLVDEEENVDALDTPDQHESYLAKIPTFVEHVVQTQKQTEEVRSVVFSDSNEHPYSEHCHISRPLRISNSAESMLEYLIERHVGGENRTILQDIQLRLKNQGRLGTFSNLHSSWHELMEYGLVRDERQEDNYLVLDVDSIWLHYTGCRICNSVNSEVKTTEETPKQPDITPSQVSHVDICAQGLNREQHESTIPSNMNNMLSKRTLQYLLDQHTKGVNSIALQQLRNYLQDTSDPMEVISKGRIRTMRQDLVSRSLVREETATSGAIMLCYIGCSEPANSVVSRRISGWDTRAASDWAPRPDSAVNDWAAEPAVDWVAPPDSAINDWAAEPTYDWAAPSINGWDTPPSSFAIPQLPNSRSNDANPAAPWHGDPLPTTLSVLAQQVLGFLIERHTAGEDTTIIPDVIKHLQKLTSKNFVPKGLSHKIRDELKEYNLTKEEKPQPGIVLMRYIGCSICETRPTLDAQSPPPSQGTMSVASHMSDIPTTPHVAPQPINRVPKLAMNDRIKNLMLIAISENKLIQGWPYVRLSIGNHSRSAPKLALVVLVSNASSSVKTEAQGMCANKDRAILLISLSAAANFENISPSLIKPLMIFAFEVGGTQNYENEIEDICADLRPAIDR